MIPSCNGALSRFNKHDGYVNVVCHFGSIFYYDGGVGSQRTSKYPLRKK
jgi:hypothetical protein